MYMYIYIFLISFVRKTLIVSLKKKDSVWC